PAFMHSPGARVTQAKLRPSSRSVTFHIAGRNLGWTTCALLPTPNGPLSSRRTLVIVGVHSGQRSTSHRTPKTFPGGAPISTATFKLFRLMARLNTPHYGKGSDVRET